MIHRMLFGCYLGLKMLRNAIFGLPLLLAEAADHTHRRLKKLVLANERITEDAQRLDLWFFMTSKLIE